MALNDPMNRLSSPNKQLKRPSLNSVANGGIFNQPANYVQAIQPINNPIQNVQNLASIARQNPVATTQQRINPTPVNKTPSFRDYLGMGLSDPYTTGEFTPEQTYYTDYLRGNTSNTKSIPTASNVNTVPMTPVQKNRQNAWADLESRQLPTSVQGVTKEMINGVPTFSNIKPTFDTNGNLVQDNNPLNTIPSLTALAKGNQTQRNSQSLNDYANGLVQPYNQGTQYSAIEDATTGGYYQRRNADRANRRTMQRLTNENKEAWGLNRQATLDNSQLQTNSLTRQLLGTQADTAQRINSLDRIIADFNASPEERLAALQTRNFLNQGAQRQQNNVVTRLTEEMPDGSKKERAVTIDPSTGREVGDVDWGNVNMEDYINEIAKRTGRPKEEIRKQLGGNIS